MTIEMANRMKATAQRYLDFIADDTKIGQEMIVDDAIAFRCIGHIGEQFLLIAKRSGEKWEQIELVNVDGANVVDDFRDVFTPPMTEEDANWIKYGKRETK